MMTVTHCTGSRVQEEMVDISSSIYCPITSSISTISTITPYKDSYIVASPRSRGKSDRRWFKVV